MSLLYVLEDGASAEIEGMIRIALFMGGETTPSRAVVQGAGKAYRLDAQMLETNSIAQVRYSAAAALYPGAYHADGADCGLQPASFDKSATVQVVVAEIDRLSSNELKMTQELIANMLGVRRSGVTEAALKPQDAALIRYSHGNIEVLDRPGLEKRVCECYGVVMREFDPPLPDLKAL